MTTGGLSRAGALLLVVMLVVAACSSSAATTAPTTAPASQAAPSAAASPAGGGGASGNAVSIIDFGFTPQSLTAKIGQEITWTNTGNAAHTVTFDSGGIDSSGTLAAGATFKHTFDAAGTFTYHCSIHSSMTGTITVSQ